MHSQILELQRKIEADKLDRNSWARWIALSIRLDGGSFAPTDITTKRLFGKKNGLIKMVKSLRKCRDLSNFYFLLNHLLYSKKSSVIKEIFSLFINVGNEPPLSWMLQEKHKNKDAISSFYSFSRDRIDFLNKKVRSGRYVPKHINGIRFPRVSQYKYGSFLSKFMLVLEP